MITTLTVIHVFVSILLIIMVLLQFGKGAETGLLDAASQGTSFGPKGNILSKTTTVLSILFLGISIGLANLRGKKASSSIMDQVAAPKARPLNSDALQPPAENKNLNEEPTESPAAETKTQ